jgi:hypothetical protein
MMVAAAPASGGIITGLTVTNLSGADSFTDDPVTGVKLEARSSTTLLSSNPIAVMPNFAARLAGLVAADTELPHTSIGATKFLHMRINFNIVASLTETWTMQIDQLRRFALTLVDDPGSGFQSQAFIDNYSATYNIVPGTSGPLVIPKGINENTSALFGTLDLPFLFNNTQFLGGTGSASVQLDFIQRIGAASYGNADPLITVVDDGQEAATRFGIAGSLPGVTADDYPGFGSRVVSDDGHFVNVKLTFIPEPASAALLTLCGLGVFVRSGRRHS